MNDSFAMNAYLIEDYDYPSSKVWQMSYKYIRHFTMKIIQIIELYDIFCWLLFITFFQTVFAVIEFSRVIKEHSRVIFMQS